MNRFTPAASRNIGLDVARSCAIGLVLLGHSFTIYLPLSDKMLALFSFGARLGVDLFFVLSGFLIGQIIIKDVLADLRLSAIPFFYIRRWFRTLPLYYAVLLFMIITRPHMGAYLIDYVVFWQGVHQEALLYFGVSWSLAVEEWFYLLVPPLLVLFLKGWRGDKIRGFFIFCGGVLCLSLAARCLYVALVPMPTDVFIMSDFTFFRMDSLIMGVLLAGLRMYKRPLYVLFSAAPRLLQTLLYFGPVLLALEQLLMPADFKNGIFDRTFLLTLVPFYFAVLILKLETSPFITARVSHSRVARVFTFISTTSYAVYLIHTPIYSALASLTVGIGGLRSDNILLYIARGCVLSAVGTVVVFVVAALIYIFYEHPLTDLRDKIPMFRYKRVFLEPKKPASKV